MNHNALSPTPLFPHSDRSTTASGDRKGFHPRLPIPASTQGMAKESPQEGKATSISSPKPQVCCGALFLGSSSRGIWDSLLYLILTRRADAQPHAQQMERIRAPFALSPAQPHVCDAGCFREAGPCACPAQEPLYRDFTQRMKKCIDSLDFLGLQNH